MKLHVPFILFSFHHYPSKYKDNLIKVHKYNVP